MTGSIWVVLPLACLVAGAFVVYLIARFLTQRNEVLATFTSGIFGVALVLLLILQMEVSAESLPMWGALTAEGAFLRVDPGAVVVIGIALGLGFLVAIYSGRYLEHDRRYELYYPLLLLLIAGLVGLVMAADLFSIYLFCELMSVSAYVLVAFRRRTRTAIEAGFKYLMMGSVGTVTLLVGISFIYREQGHLAFAQMSEASGVWTRAGAACFLVGLGVKSAFVPLHTWLPDAHGRAPSSISAILSGIIVQSAFYALLKTCLGVGLPRHTLGTVLIGLSLFNMTVGNSMALVQTYTKRLLGYSTVAQMGYMMLSVGVGLRYGLPTAIQAGLFMILVQAVMKGLAFLCKGVCHFYDGTTTVEELQGTFSHMPIIATMFGLALAGLAAVPPLAGFAGKWLVLGNVVRSADLFGFVALAVFLLNSVVALGYYLPLIGRLFAHPSRGDERMDVERAPISRWMMVPILALGVLVIVMGVYPAPWLGWMADVGTYLLALGG